MFESIDSEDCSHPDTLLEESTASTATTSAATEVREVKDDDSSKAEVDANAPSQLDETDGTTGSHVDRTTSTGSKDTSSPDEGNSASDLLPFHYLNINTCIWNKKTISEIFSKYFIQE